MWVWANITAKRRLMVPKKSACRASDDAGDCGGIFTRGFGAGLSDAFFYQFGVTVSTAVLLSLFVSFTL